MDGPGLKVATRNLCHLRLLERIAERFNAAGVPLMALKGAALLLTVYRRPQDRPMSDLDLMVHPEDAEQAVRLLEELGCQPGRPLVQRDFFPRFYYETEFFAGRSFPLRIDLHARPFRPLRYGQTVPQEAFWADAQPVRVGRASVLVPAAAHMLIHLAVHSAIHANSRDTWLRDMCVWVDANNYAIDWCCFSRHVEDWRLSWPVRHALEAVAERYGGFMPSGVMKAFARQRVDWRDRMALKQAPRDADAPTGHLITDVLCTPGVRFVLGYLWASLLPDRVHMGEWYDRRHWGWLPAAHLLRLASPMLKRVTPLWGRMFKAELAENAFGRPALFATRIIRAGECIAEDRESDRHGPGAKLRYARHSCGPNARLSGRRLIAVKVIDAGEEISFDHGANACTCRQHKHAGKTHGAAPQG